MPFPSNENHEVTFSAASDLTKRYRDSDTAGSRLGGFFSSNAIQQLLDQQNCVGIRIYYGLDESGNKELVLVGVDSEGNDQVEDGNLCMDMCVPCPTVCSTNNILNS